LSQLLPAGVMGEEKSVAPHPVFVTDELPPEGGRGLIDGCFEGFVGSFRYEYITGDIESHFCDFIFHLTGIFEFEYNICLDDPVKEMTDFSQPFFDETDKFFICLKLNGFGVYFHKPEY
jgi:hypothetical protein